MMERQSWIQRIFSRKPGGETRAQITMPIMPTVQASPSAPSTETASDDQFSGRNALTPVAAATPASTGYAEAAVSAVWQVGDVILNQYEVTGMLGEGGMGSVYKVHHRGWNIDLAVKSPKPEIFTREGGKENFIREAKTVNFEIKL